MSLLSEYHNETSRNVTATLGEDGAQDAWDISNDYAVELLSHLGFGPQDRDNLGAEIGDDVQTLLMLAMARSSVLRDAIAELIERDR